MMDILNALTLVDVTKLTLHESHEAVRLEDVLQAIHDEGAVRHPPLAVQMQNGRYLIIDGAHRTLALQRLGCKQVPVQVVEQSQFTIDAWDHIVPLGAWFQQVQRDEDILLVSDPAESDSSIAEIIQENGQHLWLKPRMEANDPLGRITLWKRVVSSYTESIKVDRRPKGELERPEPGRLLVRFPSFALPELEQVLNQGQTVPAGVTRFEIEGRLLNLFIPLRVLRERPVNKTSWALLKAEWQKKLRSYTKTVYLCE